MTLVSRIRIKPTSICWWSFVVNFLLLNSSWARSRKSFFLENLWSVCNNWRMSRMPVEPHEPSLEEESISWMLSEVRRYFGALRNFWKNQKLSNFLKRIIGVMVWCLI